MARAKRTTAQGKPDYVTREQMLNELVLSNREAGRSMDAVHQRIDKLDDEVDQLTRGVGHRLTDFTVAALKRIEEVEEELKTLFDQRTSALDAIEKLTKRVAELEKGLPADAPEPAPEPEPKADGQCVLVVGAPWKGMKIHGPFADHLQACDYQAKHLFREDFWWTMPLERTPV